MAVLRIDIAGEPRAVPYRNFLKVANDSLRILSDLDAAFSRRRLGAVEWYMNDLRQNGLLRLEIRSEVQRMKRKQLDDSGQQVVNSFVNGFNILEHEGRSPEYLTEFGMKQAEEMTSIIGKGGAEKIIASVPDEKVVEITAKAAKNIRQLLPAPYRSIGSVEGRLETVSVHGGRPRFIVYDSLTDKAITCNVGKLKILDKVKEILGARVMVSGIISRNVKGEPVKIAMETENDLKVFGSDDLKILPFKKLGGSDPDFAGGLSSEEYIRRWRG